LKKTNSSKSRIKKDDIVIIISGKERGKQGIVLEVKNNKKLMVEGINLKKKHFKGNPQRQKPGGIIKKESFIDASNVAIFNKETLKSDKIAYKKLDGKKIRVFKSNKKDITYKG
jgi:large subunit ribosomal protein L24